MPELWAADQLPTRDGGVENIVTLGPPCGLREHSNNGTKGRDDSS